MSHTAQRRGPDCRQLQISLEVESVMPFRFPCDSPCLASHRKAQEATVHRCGGHLGTTWHVWNGLSVAACSWTAHPPCALHSFTGSQIMAWQHPKVSYSIETCLVSAMLELQLSSAHAYHPGAYSLVHMVPASIQTQPASLVGMVCASESHLSSTLPGPGCECSPGTPAFRRGSCDCCAAGSCPAGCWSTSSAGTAAGPARQLLF